MSKSKTILITGGTGKLGSQFVKHFLAQGYTVIVTSRNPKNLNDLNKTVKSSHKGKRLLGLVVDLEKISAAQEIYESLHKKKVSLDALINNARNKDYLSMSNSGPSRSHWLGEFFLDVVVPYELSLALTTKFFTLKSIINVSSMYGVVAANPKLYNNPTKESPIHYSVAKAALIHLTKELAVRLAQKGVRVNCISYGGVEGRAGEDFKKRYAQFCPSGRMLKDSEVVGAAEFLVSDASLGMTGHNLMVDGGWSVW